MGLSWVVVCVWLTEVEEELYEVEVELLELRVALSNEVCGRAALHFDDVAHHTVGKHSSTRYVHCFHRILACLMRAMVGRLSRRWRQCMVGVGVSGVHGRECGCDQPHMKV